MPQTMENNAQAIDPATDHGRTRALQARWLDKLWQQLFDGDSGGLLSPDQIRREHRDWRQVRQLEMALILEAERDIALIHQGRKRLDPQGNLIDVALPEQVATLDIIVDDLVRENLDLGRASPSQMLRSAVNQVGVRDLERSLNLRKLAILAEAEILATNPGTISPHPVSAEWMLRWRDLAQNVFNPELQNLWARLLVGEVARPGRYPLGILATLGQCEARDLEALSIISKYVLGEFIFDARGRYFKQLTHQPLFDVLADLGLIQDAGPGGQVHNLQSQRQDSFLLQLDCHQKALRITHPQPAITLELPVLRLSRIGRELCALVGGEADVAYLFDLGLFCKAAGFTVALGECPVTAPGERHFNQRLIL